MGTRKVGKQSGAELKNIGNISTSAADPQMGHRCFYRRPERKGSHSPSGAVEEWGKTERTRKTEKQDKFTTWALILPIAKQNSRFIAVKLELWQDTEPTLQTKREVN